MRAKTEECFPVRGLRALVLVLLLLLLLPATVLAANWSATVAAPDRVDRQEGPRTVGERADLSVTLVNSGPVDLRLEQVSVGFRTATTSADGQYLVTRPALPITVSALSTRLVTIQIRPWATATVSTTVTVGVTLFGADVVTGSVETRAASTQWRIADAPELLIGQSSYGTVRGRQLGMDGPRGVYSDGARLYVCDQNNHRVLIYKPVPSANQPTPAVVLGQPDLAIIEANTNGLSARSLNTPLGVCAAGQRLFVADTGNHRVLIWNSIPTRDFTPADVVLGQTDFRSNAANAGGRTATTFNRPMSVWTDGRRLIVADQLNSRVLIWTTIPTASGTPADMVIGQPSFSSGTANNGGIGAASLNLVEGASMDGTRLVVADTGNHRVLVWNSFPTGTFQPASLVVGQVGFSANGSGTTSQTFKSPTWAQSDGIRLIVVDSLNRRVPVFTPVPSTSNPSASQVVGQPNYTQSTEQGINAGVFFRPACAFSDGDRLWVADQSICRVLSFSPFPTAQFAAQANQVSGHPDMGHLGPNLAGAILSLAGRQIFGPSQVVVHAAKLLAADALHRILIYDPVPLLDDPAAVTAVGQFNLIQVATPIGGGVDLASAYGVGVLSDGKLLGSSGAERHRISVWNSIPSANGTSAAFVIGQTDFNSVTNGQGTVGVGKFALPQGIATTGIGFYVCDQNNSRVLRFDSVAPGATASLVLGQADFNSRAVNRGGSVTAATLANPRNAAIAGGKLLVADTANSRVLIWNAVPSASGQSADRVLGQSAMTLSAANRGGSPSADTLNFPDGVAFDGARVAVADTRNHRVLIWNGLPASNGAAADLVLGQDDAGGNRPNLGRLSRFALSSPSSVTLTGSSLYVSDTGNSRILRFDLPPLARVRVDAGPDRFAPLGSLVRLSATTSGSPAGPVAHSWAQEDGPVPMILAGSSTANASFTATAGGHYAFRVTVTDGGPTVGVDRVHVLVDTPPVVPAIPDRILNPGPVSLDARGSFDPDGDPLRYAWAGVGASTGLFLSGANEPVAGFEPTPGTTSTIQLTVSDGRGGVVSRTTRVTVRRNPRVIVVASPPLGAAQVARLDARGSSDPDGGALQFAWEQIPAPTVSLSPSPASPIVTFLTPVFDSLLAFRLTLTNANGGKASSITTITVDGTPPGVTLGLPQGAVASARGPFRLEFDFSEPISTVPTPTVSFVRNSGAGTLAGGPLRPRVLDTDRTRFEFAFDAAFKNNGSYTIVVGASDRRLNSLAQQPPGNTLTVGIANNPPVALAVGPSTATSGTTVTVDGVGSSDPDGDSFTYSWTGTDPSGSSIPITNPTSSRPRFIPTRAGAFTVRLVVRDVHGVDSAPSAVSINVAAPGAGNRAPTASAGAQQLVAAGQLVTLHGTASDPDGDPLTFKWQLLSRPAGSAIQLGLLGGSQGGASLEPFFTPDRPGSYSFVLTVTDRFLATNQSAVVIVVDDHANTPASSGLADRLDSAGATMPATIEAPGDVDVFSFQSATGSLYRVNLRVVTATQLQVQLLDGDATTVISAAQATTLTRAVLPDFRPAVSGTQYLRVSGSGLAAQGSYELRLERTTEPFVRPPPTTLSIADVAGQLEATVRTEGTSVPLSFVQFLVEYDSADITLVGRNAEAGASGFTVDAQQFSLPFIDTLLAADGRPRPLPAGPLVSLSFRPAASGSPRKDGVRMLAVSATPPPPSARVTTFRPTADAGLALTLTPARGPGGLEQLPDFADPALPLRSYLRLDARASRDSNRPSLPLRFRWHVLEAPSAQATLSNPESPIPTVRLAGAGLYRFGLQVSNGVLESTTSIVQYLIRGDAHAPDAAIEVSTSGSSEPARDAQLGAFGAPAGSFVRLDGSASADQDAADRPSLGYSWEQSGGPVRISLPPTAAVSFQAVVEGTYSFELTVRDRGGLSSRPARAVVVVFDPSDVLPALSISAVSSTTSAVGGDLGPSPDTSPQKPIRVVQGADVTLQARASDPQFTQGSQTGQFSWTQTRGPVVRLAQIDTPPSGSRVTFVAGVNGVLEFECRLQEATRTGSLLGPEVARRIRIVTDDPARPLPAARALVRAGPPAKTAGAPALALGTTILLDGSASGSGPGGTAIPLSYRWVQVQGPVVQLSNPVSAVTTFVAPDLGDGRLRQYAFQLFVDDAVLGGSRSAPALAVAEAAAGASVTTRSVTLSFAPGPNLIGIPVKPDSAGFDVAALARLTGASAIVFDTEVDAGPTKFRVYLPDLSPESPLVSGSAGYLVLIPGDVPRNLILTGRPWRTEETPLLQTRRGLALAALPGRPKPGMTLADLEGSLSSSDAVFTKAVNGGRSRFVFVPRGDRAAEPLVEGRGYLYFGASSKRVSLFPLVRDER